MTNTMIAGPRTRTITPEVITAARMLVLITHPGDASLGRALEKAASRLITLAWTIDCGILQIASQSHPTDVHATDGTTCTCEATRGVCWHVGSWLMLSTIAAAGINPVAALPLPRAALDENIDDYAGDDEWPDSFLDSLNDGAFDENGDLARTPRRSSPSPVIAAPFPEPYRPRSRVHVPAVGSDFARAQELVDRMFAA